MSRNRPDFRKAMGQVLSANGIAKINFTVKGFRVHGPHFARVKKLLLQTALMDVRFSTADLGTAESSYSGHYNRYTFQDALENQVALDPLDWLLIVHESTHAVFDLCKVSGVTEVEEEIAARLAEQLFYVRQVGRIAYGFKELQELHDAVVSSPGLEITDHSAFPAIKKWIAGIGSYSSTRAATHDGIE